MKAEEKELYPAQLISKLLKGKITSKEKIQLNAWLEENEQNRIFFNNATDPSTIDSQLALYRQPDFSQAWEKLQTGMDENPIVPKLKPLYKTALRYAAVLIPLTVIGSLVLYHSGRHQPVKRSILSTAANKVVPLKNKNAILILSNGKSITLGNDSTPRTLQEEDGTSMNNRGDELTYEGGKEGNDTGRALFNQVITPIGQRYKLVLADGTNVWLNAASDLRFPAAFKGSERRVYLTGEAYFEVAKNKSLPFIVQTRKTEVLVLGTHFDVSAYEDGQDNVTTLLEGSVKVKSHANMLLLRPGEQAQVNNEDFLSINQTVTPEDAIAWKSELFQFRESNIQQVMRQAARWYGVDVIYEGRITAKRFSGRISRNVDLDGFIDVFKFQGIHVRKEGNKIIVTN